MRVSLLLVAAVLAFSSHIVTMQTAAGALVLVDDFNRSDSASVGTTSENPSLIWDERLAVGGAVESPADAVQIKGNQLYIGNSTSASTGTHNGMAELGPFPNDLVLCFDLDFGPITSSGDPEDFERWGIETFALLRHPDNGEVRGTADFLAAGSVMVGITPNGNMILRTSDGSNLLDERFYDSAGVLQSGNASHADPTYSMTGTHAIKLSMIGSELKIFVDDMITPKVTTAIGDLGPVPILSENYIALGKYLRTSSGIEARYDPRFDNVKLSVVPEPASFLLLSMAGMMFGFLSRYCRSYSLHSHFT